MRNYHLPLLVLAASLQFACLASSESIPENQGQSDDSASSSSAARIVAGSVHISATSSDRSLIAYVTGCTGDRGSALFLLDLASNKTAKVATGSFSCYPSMAGPNPIGAALSGADSISFSSDNSRLAVSTPDSGFYLWNIASRKREQVSKRPALFLFSKDNQKIAFSAVDPTGASAPRLFVYDVAKGRSNMVADGAIPLQFAPNSSELLFGVPSTEPFPVYSLAVWNLNAKTATTLTDKGLPLAATKDGSSILFGADLDWSPTSSSATLTLYHFGQKATTPLKRVVNASPNLIFPVALNNDGSKVAWLDSFEWPAQVGSLKVWSSDSKTVELVDSQVGLIPFGMQAPEPARFAQGGSSLLFLKPQASLDPSQPRTSDLHVYSFASRTSALLDSGLDGAVLSSNASGQRLAYTKGVLMPWSPVGQLFVYDLTSMVPSQIESAVAASSVAFTATGDRLVFLGNYYQPVGNIAGDLKVLDFASSTLKLVSSNAYQGVLSPDGHGMAFLRKLNADPEDINVAVGYQNLSVFASNASTLDKKGGNPFDLTVANNFVVYAKQDGLYRARVK